MIENKLNALADQSLQISSIIGGTGDFGVSETDNGSFKIAKYFKQK